MACDKSTLETNACSNGFTQAAQNEAQFRALVLQLLCTISEGASVSSDLRAADYGGIEPNWTPSGTLGQAVDTVTERVWLYYSGSWH